MGWAPPTPPAPPPPRVRSAKQRTLITLSLVAVVVVALALIGAGADDSGGSGAPSRVQDLCADFILAGDDWQDGRTVDSEFRAELLDFEDRASGTVVEAAFEDAATEFTQAMQTGDSSTVIPVLRSLGRRCGDLLPD